MVLRDVRALLLVLIAEGRHRHVCVPVELPPDSRYEYREAVVRCPSSCDTSGVVSTQHIYARADLRLKF